MTSLPMAPRRALILCAFLPAFIAPPAHAQVAGFRLFLGAAAPATVGSTEGIERVQCSEGCDENPDGENPDGNDTDGENTDGEGPSDEGAEPEDNGSDAGRPILLPEPATPVVAFEQTEDSAVGPDNSVLTRPSTRQIARLLLQANESCGTSIEVRYRIDCLRVHYLRAADALPKRGDYDPIRTALLDAAAELDTIVSANLDTTADPIRPRYGNQPAAPRMPRLRAVAPEAESAALAAAEAVVIETAAVILRSGEDPTRRTAHFQAIAAAVDSNLVILRSA